MELIITSPKETDFVKAIEFNYDELKSELSANLEKYRNVVYGENDIKDAEGDRAKLNKFSAALDDKRKEIKNKCLEPYEPFAVKINELVDMVKEQSSAIDVQIKAYEAKYKDGKTEEIREYWNSVIGDLAELLPLNAVFNAKWLNKGARIKAIQAEIDGIIAKTKDDLAAIDSLESEFQVEVKSVYLKTFDLGEALRRNEYLKSQKAAQESRERAIAEANAKRGIEQPKPQPVAQPKSEPQAQTQSAEPKRRYEFWVEMDREQTAALRQFLITNNIQYGSIKNGK